MKPPDRHGASVVASDWGYHYPGRARPTVASVSFAIRPGELVVLLGASGSGKSTLLAALAGILPAAGASGELRVTAEEPLRTGLVQQDPEGNIVMELLGDDVAFPLENFAVAANEIWPRVTDASSSVGLDLPLDRATARMSGGQQQLLAVAASTVAIPHLLLLDEPTANLDPDAARRVLRAVEDFAQRTGCTVVVVEHRAQPWLSRADRALLVHDGRLAALDVADLQQQLALRPDAAARVWLDRRHLPHHPAARPAREVRLQAVGVAVTGRLASTSIEARSGEVVALTGPPGSGKSTLLACLGGLLRPSQGRITVAMGGASACDPWRWPAAEVATTFGSVFQNPEHQFVTGTVSDELRHGLAVAGMPATEVAERLQTMLGRLGLADLARADPFTLSGGEQRRLSVGSALVLDPRILLLDEPTFGQDPTTWRQIVAVIAEHRDAGGTVVLATHDPDVVAALDAREVRLGAPSTDAAVGAATPKRLRALDPLALVGAAGLISTAALLSASVAFNLTLAALSLAAAVLGGLPMRRVGLLAVPAAIACVSVATSNALLSGSGLTSAQSWAAAALPASRVLAVALPGLVAAVAVDPTALADSLFVRARVPARGAYSVLAGLRLLPLLTQEWTILGRASRARGLGGTGVRQRARQFVSMTFRLLVAALRRGGRLAIALDARGLRAGAPRTVARPLTWGFPATAALLFGALVLVAAAATRASL